MTERLRRIALDAFGATLAALDAEKAVSQTVVARAGGLEIAGHHFSLADSSDIRVAAIGKAADAMMRGMGTALERTGVPRGRLRGLVVSHTPGLPVFEWCDRLVGGHPVPTRESFAAGRRLLELFDGCTSETLAIFLVSGGGSALVEVPRYADVSDDDMIAFHRELVLAGLPIRAMNAVRKRLSAIKGGRLAAHAAPARLVTLIVSDVAPGDTSAVASGPTVADESSPDEVIAATSDPAFRQRVPSSIAGAIRRAIHDEISGNGMHVPGGLVVTVLDSRIVADTAAAGLSSAAEVVVNLGPIDGELVDVIDRHLELLEASIRTSRGGTVAVVSGGEVTVRVDGDGVGGRNAHSALYALARMDALCPSVRDVVVLSAGTDGRDGPTDSAGAIADREMLAAASRLGLSIDEALRRFDSYSFFNACDGLVVTGSTGTNARDVRIVLGRSETVSSAV